MSRKLCIHCGINNTDGLTGIAKKEDERLDWQMRQYPLIGPVRIRSFTATTIYPDHSAGNRSGLRRGESSRN